MISGTTARSWNSSTPMIFWPWGVLNSARSTSILLTIAVEDIASTPPSARPARQSSPKNSEESMTSRMVATTWAVPRPNTRRCMLCNRARLNSRPMLNIRNTTPNSARWRVSGASGIQPSAWGPIQDADQEITQHRRQFQDAEQHDHAHGDRKQNQQERQGVSHERVLAA